jgi:hypothetical protein
MRFLLNFFKYRDLHVTFVKNIVRFMLDILAGIVHSMFDILIPDGTLQSVRHASEGTFTNPCQNELLLRS